MKNENKKKNCNNIKIKIHFIFNILIHFKFYLLLNNYL